MDKEQLKEQLKKQQSKKEVFTPNDPRVQGYNRVYFFQRIADDYIFPLDAELQAHHLMRRKDFNHKYKYLGWSPGKYLAEYKNMPQTVLKYSEGANITDESRDRVNDRMGVFNELFAKELEEAIDNPDKSLPRDFKVRDLSGNIADGYIAGQLRGYR